MPATALSLSAWIGPAQSDIGILHIARICETRRLSSSGDCRVSIFRHFFIEHLSENREVFTFAADLGKRVRRVVPPTG